MCLGGVLVPHPARRSGSDSPAGSEPSAAVMSAVVRRGSTGVEIPFILEAEQSSYTRQNCRPLPTSK